jgi:Fur family transcriptional regulator, ferric uptake regulator
MRGPLLLQFECMTGTFGRVPKSKITEDVTTPSLRDRIRKSGLRATSPRIAVLRIMQAVESPLSHQDVSERLTDTGLDHATVYRNLVDLTEAGVLSRTDMGDHRWRFEMRRSDVEHTQQHPHFICTDCGTVLCLPEASVRLKAAPGTPRALGGRLAIQLQGRCDDCLGASRGR